MYGFSVIYLYFSQQQPQNFGVGKLDVISAFYFGWATAMTYGDLDPITPLGKVLVMMQLALNFIYALFLLSAFAGAIQTAGRSSNSSSND
ncbi:ion channel [Streptosporangium saharense]|uniref:Potassium channel domain-containing protein n=1 Tax=Streptosporangium saharense TaxID=1706840 RepID=A0A7W7VLJ2_9ACTN|nr:ion channel [Streptosporangium saharense]MBB4914444.1 hypothetical protein [Streptosporangium saharense]